MNKTRLINSPRCCQLWVNVTAGTILGHDVTQWEADLATEADHLERIKAEYKPLRRQFESEIKATMESFKESEADVNALKSGQSMEAIAWLKIY